MITRLAQFTDVRAALVVGGLSLQVQAATLRTHPEVVVATPVRLARGSGLRPGPWAASRCRCWRPCCSLGWLRP